MPDAIGYVPRRTLFQRIVISMNIGELAKGLASARGTSEANAKAAISATFDQIRSAAANGVAQPFKHCGRKPRQADCERSAALAFPTTSIRCSFPELPLGDAKMGKLALKERLLPVTWIVAPVSGCGRFLPVRFWSPVSPRRTATSDEAATMDREAETSAV
jgi:hypothetical protein